MLFRWPVDNCFVTNYFNARASYPNAPKRLQKHEGIDLAPALKDADNEYKVRSAQDGVVYQTGFDAKGYGNYIIIKHSDRYYTWYGHLEEVLVEENADVTYDTEIGIMGNTGNSRGKHLHFNVQDFNDGLTNYVVTKVVDPLPLMVSKIDSCNISIMCYNIVNRLIK